MPKNRKQKELIRFSFPRLCSAKAATSRTGTAHQVSLVTTSDLSLPLSLRLKRNTAAISLDSSGGGGGWWGGWGGGGSSYPVRCCCRRCVTCVRRWTVPASLPSAWTPCHRGLCSRTSVGDGREKKKNSELRMHESVWERLIKKTAEQTCCIVSQSSEACNPRLPPLGPNRQQMKIQNSSNFRRAAAAARE